jgi:hypothetical protein
VWVVGRTPDCQLGLCQRRLEILGHLGGARREVEAVDAARCADARRRVAAARTALPLLGQRRVLALQQIDAEHRRPREAENDERPDDHHTSGLATHAR